MTQVATRPRIMKPVREVMPARAMAILDQSGGDAFSLAVGEAHESAVEALVAVHAIRRRIGRHLSAQRSKIVEVRFRRTGRPRPRVEVPIDLARAAGLIPANADSASEPAEASS
jgi:hypothetical protein